MWGSSLKDYVNILGGGVRFEARGVGSLGGCVLGVEILSEMFWGICNFIIGRRMEGDLR